MHPRALMRSAAVTTLALFVVSGALAVPAAQAAFDPDDHLTHWTHTGGWTGDIDLSPDGRRLYMSMNGESTVGVMDATNGRMVATIPVRPGPARIDVSPDSRRVYVAHLDYSRLDNCVVSEIDAASLTVVREIHVGSRCAQVVVSPDGGSLFVPAEVGSVSVVDLASGAVVGALPARGQVSRLALAAGDTLLWASDRDRTLSALDIATSSPLGDAIPLPAPAIALASSPDGRTVYATVGSGLPGEDAFVVVDRSAGRVVQTLRLGDDLDDVVLSPAGDVAYVSSPYEAKVWVIDTATATVLRTIQLPPAPGALAVSPDGERLYVGGVGGVGYESVLTLARGIEAFSYPSARYSAKVGTRVSWSPNTAWLSDPSFRVSPALPAGLSLGLMTGVISGTPKTGQAARTYTVTADDGWVQLRFSFTISVSKASTSAKLSLSSKTQKYYGSKPVKATVAVGPATLAGTVSFYDGSKRLKAVKVVKGKASFVLPRSLKRGAHRIKAVFAPSASGAYTSSTSSTIAVTVVR